MMENNNNPDGQEHRRKRFVNPYNFVPLEQKCDRSSTQDQPGKLTGYLACTLKTLTPIFIPNTSNDRALRSAENGSDSKSYDFFSYTNLEGKEAAEIIANPPAEPIIPGSAIRGMIRSVFEAAFNGCMSSVELERVLGRRSLTAKQPGILKKNKEKWEIIPCERWMLNVTRAGNSVNKGKPVLEETYNAWEEGMILYVKSDRQYFKKVKGREIRLAPLVTEWAERVRDHTGWKVSYLHKGEPLAGKKHHESVFVKQPNAERIEVAATELKWLQEVINQYRNHNKEWYKGYEIKESGTLVYYCTLPGTDTLYMTPACISKEIFRKNIGNLLQKQGGYQPCVDQNQLCPACVLFGMAAKGEKQGNLAGARGSRLRFTDAKIEGQDQKGLFLEPATLPEMGVPKPSAVEFYTFPPTPPGREGSYNYWTYDYSTEGERLIPLWDNQPKLRGRKFYWHSDAASQYLGNKDELKNMRQRIRPLRAEVEFIFKIYFENITEQELANLCWALTFNDHNCAHKIGRGKPLGFGSVRIQIDKIRCREFDRETGMWSCPLKKSQPLEKKETDAMKSVKIMTKSEQGLPVSYPRPSSAGNEVKSYKWFAANHKMKDNTFVRILPTPEEETGTDPSKWLVYTED